MSRRGILLFIYRPLAKCLAHTKQRGVSWRARKPNPPELAPWGSDKYLMPPALLHPLGRLGVPEAAALSGVYRVQQKTALQ